MTGFFLALLMAAPSPAADRPDALDPLKTAEIVDPLAKCLRTRISAHRVKAAQVGREDAARNLATGLMAACGAGDAQARLVAAMRSADPALSSDEAQRRVGALLGSVLSTAAIQAREHFRVAYDVPIEIVDCPRTGAPQPEACARKQEVSLAKPIDVPFQAIEPFSTYQRCVLDRFDVAMRSVHNFEEARQAHFDSVAACRDVRAVQLARALEEVTDRQIYGSRAKARAAARLAFDRFDSEFDMEWDSPPPSSGTVMDSAGRGRSN